MTAAIRIENVSKLYRLGTVGTGTIAHDLNRWWHTIRGKEDPYAKIGQVNDRTKAAKSEEQGAGGDGASAPNSPLSALRSRAAGPDYVWALRDINLEVEQGEVLGIIGRNGAGKSTLLKLLSRVTAPTTGSIKTKGRIASLLEVGTGFHPDLTGRENIYMNGAILGMRRHEITRQLDEIVEFSGCAKYLDTPVKRYSSGMTVRLGFAVAAHLDCEILIVDEVLAVGDSEFQKKCMGKLGQVSRLGRTVLFVSHNMQAVRQFCSRACLLTNGSIKLVGPSEAIVQSYFAENNAASLKATRLDFSTLPPDKDFRLLGFHLEQDGSCTTNVVSGKPVVVVIKYELYSDLRGFHVYFELRDAEETLIFESLHNGAEEDIPYMQAGVFESRAVIPSDFLSGMRYEVRLRAGINNVRSCINVHVALPLLVEPLGKVNQAYPGYYTPGRLAPLLEWNTFRV